MAQRNQPSCRPREANSHTGLLSVERARPALSDRVSRLQENWQKESGQPVSREELLLSLQNLEAIMIQTVYDNRMATVGLSNIVMDTTTAEVTGLGVAHHVEECRCQRTGGGARLWWSYNWGISRIKTCLGEEGLLDHTFPVINSAVAFSYAFSLFPGLLWATLVQG